MKEVIGRRAYDVYAMDTETHADEESIAAKKTGVWLLCFINDESKMEDESSYFYDVDSWLDKIEEMTIKKRRKHRKSEVAKNRPHNLLIYDFNLAFEWSFILPVLLKRGFKYKEEINSDDSFCYNTISTKTCSSVWKIVLKFGKNNGIIVFRDLHKIFGGTLRGLAKSMNLATQKGEIDYKINRLHDWKVTAEEKEYCFKDTRIIVEVLEKFRGEQRDEDFWRSVSSATYSCMKMLRAGYPKAIKTLQAYRKDYPLLSDEENEFIHHSIAGGLTYSPTEWQFRNISGKIKHIDYHQSYPSSMASMRYELFPYGVGTYGKGKPNLEIRKMSCCHVRVSYSGVKLHSVIKLIGIDLISDCELWLWDFEIKVMKKAYIDLEIEYIDYYQYSCKKLPFGRYFKENFRKRLEAKARGDDFLVLLYKLWNNACYGKFEENPHLIAYENIVDENGRIDSIIHNVKEVRAGQFAYFPVGSCISAYARSRLISDALLISPSAHSILYMDTDSLFYLDNEETREGIKRVRVGDNLGDFGFEPDIKMAQFAAPKRYKLLLENGKSDIKMGGVTLPNDATFENSNLIDGVFSARTHKRVDGGTLIIDTTKVIGVQDKYKKTYLQNIGNDYNNGEGD